MNMKRIMAIAAKVIFAVFVFSIFVSIGCAKATDPQHPFQKYIEGVVEKVEYSQTGGGFMHPGNQNVYIYFSDGRTFSLPGGLTPPKTIVVGKFNRIWFADNGAPWIRDAEQK